MHLSFLPISGWTRKLSQKSNKTVSVSLSAPEARRAILAEVRAGRYPVWVPGDFVALGKGTVVDQALSDLTRSGELRRVGRGLYVLNPVAKLGSRPLSTEPMDVVDAIMRRKRTRYIVDEQTAANDLGWETAVPKDFRLLTDDRRRPVKIGNLTVTFVPCSAKRMSWAGNPGMRVVQALYYYRDTLKVDRAALDEKLQRLWRLASDGPAIREALTKGFNTLPSWMAEVLRPHLFEDT